MSHYPQHPQIREAVFTNIALVNGCHHFAALDASGEWINSCIADAFGIELLTYRELLSHPREATDKYRASKTAGSTIVPLLRLWETKLPSKQPSRFAKFTSKYLPHCNSQLWFPDEDSEERIYTGDVRHGAMLNGVSVGEDLQPAWDALLQETDGHRHFEALSAIELQHWPIVLMACRHYRIPVPPNLWIDLIRPS